MVTQRNTSVEEINRIFMEEAASEYYRDILGVTSDPTVSADMIKDRRALIVDLAKWKPPIPEGEP